jgi:hypothetical protein
MVCVLGVGLLHAQSIHYVYDDLGRLSRVIDEATGECAVYEYDAVGNILAIARETNCLRAPTVNPPVVAPGADPDLIKVTITGSDLLGATLIPLDPALAAVLEIMTSETSLTASIRRLAPGCDPVSVAFVVQTPFCCPSGSADCTGSACPIVAVQLGAPSNCLTYGQMAEGSLNAASEVDTFTFIAAANDWVTVRVATPGDSLDPCVSMVTLETGTVLKQDCGTTEARVDVGPLVGGIYKIRIRDPEGHTGAYAIALERLVPATGAAGVFGQPQPGTLDPATNPLDVYVLTNTALQPVHLKVTATLSESNFDPVLEVYAPNGTCVLEGGCGKISATREAAMVLAAGTYAVVVHDHGLDAAGSYKFLVTQSHMTVASSPVVVTLPSSGGAGGSLSNVTIAAPPLVSVVLPGSGQSGGFPVNVTVAAPPVKVEFAP